MRPLRLTLEGLRSFRTPVTIDFHDRRHFAIVGDTGAGKSSLLEAITYALYGRTTFSGQANQELMNDTSTQLRVTLDFTVSGQRWSVTRLLKRSGDRRVGSSQAVLKLLADSGAVVEQIDKARQVDERIREVLGLDFEAFVRTVLLPQGQFAKLLVGDTPTKRAQILGQIWRTDELVRIGETAQNVLAQLKPVMARIDQALINAPSDPPAHHEMLTIEASAAVATAEAATAALRNVEAGYQEMRRSSELVTTAEAARAELAAMDIASARLTAQEVASAHNVIAARQNSLRKDQASARRELGEIPSDTDGWDAPTIATLRSTVGHLADLAPGLWDEVRALTEIATNAAATRNRADALRIEAEQSNAVLAERERERAALTVEAESARNRLVRAETALALARDAQSRASEATACERVLIGQAETAAQAAIRGEEEARSLRSAAVAADAALAAAERANTATTAARGLHPSDDCPVCHRMLPEEWAPPPAPDLESAERAAKAAREVAESADREAVRLRVTVSQTEQTVIDGREASRCAHALVTERVAELARIMDVEVDSAEVDLTNDEVLLPLVEEAATAATRLDELGKQVSDLTRSDAAARARAGEAARRAVEQAEDLRKAECRAGERLDRLQTLRNGLPDRLRTLVHLPKTLADLASLPQEKVLDAETIESSLGARQRILDEREERRTSLREDIERVQNALDDLELRITNEVGEPTKLLAADLDHVRDILRNVRGRLIDEDGRSAGPKVPPGAAAIPPWELPAQVERLADTKQALLTVAEDRAKDAAERRSKTERTIRDLAAALDLPEDSSIDSIVASAQIRAQDADFNARTKRAAAAEFARQLQPLIDLRAAHQHLTTSCRVIEDMAAALKPGAFPKWLVLRRSRTLLAYASRLLDDMTGGRHVFADFDHEEDEWLIVDKESGHARSPASLSGGEQFLVSLALALGMVEMMSRSGGRLESLWLDEGFGALDSTNLDAAVSALRNIASNGRTVAVISHVRAVAEQIDHVLAVTRTASGSRAHWLTSTERTEAMDGDLAAAVSEAFSGLLH